MKLAEVIAASKAEAEELGENFVEIRIATNPELRFHVLSGKFYDAAEDERGKRLNIEPIALDVDQIHSNDWEFEKRIWVGKKERKTEVAK